MQDKVARYTAYALELSKAPVADDRCEDCCYEEGMLRRRVTKAMVSLCESSVVVGLVYREVKLVLVDLPISVV